MSKLHKKTLFERKGDLAPVRYKSISIKDIKEFKVDEESRTVSGYLAIWGNKDSDSDILIKGCCAKSITERGPNSGTHRKIAFCWQHDIKDPIGRFTILKEDEIGLYFEAVLDLGVENADRALIQLKSGTLDQFSIGYQYIWDKIEYDETLDAFIIKEINLFEGSVVTMGANEETFFAGMKSAVKAKAEKDLFDTTESFIKSLHPKFQYEARQLIQQHIQCAKAMFAKDTADTTADEDDDSDDNNIAFIDAFADHMDTGDGLIDDCYDDLDDDAVIGMADDIKAFHTDMRTKMEDFKSNNGKSQPLKPRKPAGRKTKKPLQRPEPGTPAPFDITKLANAI